MNILDIVENNYFTYSSCQIVQELCKYFWEFAKKSTTNCFRDSSKNSSRTVFYNFTRNFSRNSSCSARLSPEIPPKVHKEIHSGIFLEVTSTILPWLLIKNSCRCSHWYFFRNFYNSMAYSSNLIEIRFRNSSFFQILPEQIPLWFTVVYFPTSTFRFIPLKFPKAFSWWCSQETFLRIIPKILMKFLSRFLRLHFHSSPMVAPETSETTGIIAASSVHVPDDLIEELLEIKEYHSLKKNM